MSNPRIANYQLDTLGRNAAMLVMRNVPLTTTGDVLIGGGPTGWINSSLFAVSSIVCWGPTVNGVAGDIIAGQTAPIIQLYTAPAGGGTSLTAAALTISALLNTTGTTSIISANGVTTVALAGPVGIWVRVNTAAGLSGAACNITIYGNAFNN